MYTPSFQFKRVMESAQTICDRAEAQERDITDAEFAEVKTLVSQAKKAKSEAALADKLDSMISGKGNGMSSTKTSTLLDARSSRRGREGPHGDAASRRSK